MFKRRKIVAGNWKMNNNRVEAKELIEGIKPLVEGASCEVVLCVPFTNLETAVGLTSGTKIGIGAQNCHFEKSGAFTGEISAPMLKELCVSYVILGHSERRQYFAETNKTVNLRLKAALKEGLTAIVCVGEVLSEYEQGLTKDVVLKQFEECFLNVSAEEMERVVLAYEPVWAIGTGKTATAKESQEVCGFIRMAAEKKYGGEVAKKLRILYGGSMNSKNAAELLKMEDIDGGLIGGASLKAGDFSKIVEAAD